MSGIQSSSRKITDIIGVVATEVRSLARRSAEAAKEIKHLITSSVEQVDSGSSLVDGTVQTMGEVVEQVRRVTELVGMIAASSSEQSNGIGQLNQAISRMDQATQQNAALVEETSAAAESLSHQADELSQAMRVFKVPASLRA
jgi:methyl-accepting chemotaxis protein